MTVLIYINTNDGITTREQGKQFQSIIILSKRAAVFVLSGGKWGEKHH